MAPDRARARIHVRLSVVLELVRLRPRPLDQHGLACDVRVAFQTQHHHEKGQLLVLRTHRYLHVHIKSTRHVGLYAVSTSLYHVHTLQSIHLSLFRHDGHEEAR